MTITYVGAGTMFTDGDYNTNAVPALPAGIASGDLLICFSSVRSNGTLSSTWTTQASNNGSSTYLLVSYRVATGSDSSPTITPASVLASQHHASVVLAFRGVDPIAPFGTNGTSAQYASAEDIGPVSAATATAANGAVIVAACRNDSGTQNPAISVLAGDGLTWVEAAEGRTGEDASHLVVDYAIWSGAAPTLTAKTFDVATSTASTSAGVMLLLNPQATSNVSYVGRGNVDTFDDGAPITVTLPSGISNGDILFLSAYLVNNGTIAVSGGGGGWVQHSITDTVQNGSQFYLKTCYRFVDGTQSAPTLTVSGASTPQTCGMASIAAYRGINQSSPFGTDGTDSFNASAVNIGPIAAPSGLPPSGAAIVLGYRNGAEFETVGTLTGDGLTWVNDIAAAFTLSGQGFSEAMYHATWQTSAPTLTAKTIVPGVTTSGPGFGKIFILRGSDFSGVQERTATLSVDAAVSVSPSLSVSVDTNVVALTGNVWVGTGVIGDDNDVLTPGLPANISNNDLLIAFGYLRNAGTLAISGGGGGWTQHSLTDTTQNGSSFYLQTWFKWVDGSQAAPTITPTGGSTSPQSMTTAFVIAVRGINQLSPFGTDGPDSFNAVLGSVGPISVPTSLPSSGIVLVIAIRNATPWTSANTLSGDGMTWVEISDTFTNVIGGLGTAIAIDYASWSGGAPSLTAKTLTSTGGAGGPGMGKMFVLNTSVTTNTLNFSADTVVVNPGIVFFNADVSVSAPSTFSKSYSADCYVTVAGIVNTKSVAIDVAIVAQSIPSVVRTFNADVVVAAAVVQRSIVTYVDVVVSPAITSPTAALSAVGEMSMETTDTAWLVLLTLDHPDLGGNAIRVTSDGVPTISRNVVYSPFPFEVILPDDVEGRPPQAQLRIDNTTQEIIAALRGLVTPPSLTIEIIRSITPDVVEYGWTGLDWTTSSYDKNNVTGTLTMVDLTREEFPYVTFSTQWRGLFS